MRRNRFLYFALCSMVIALGMASRRYAATLPMFLAEYAGDTLWALMVFLGIGILAPQWSTFRVAVVALGVSYAVEISQLYHASWIDSLRNTRLGGLALGYGFLWSDLVCYTVGVALGMTLDIAVKQAAEWRQE